MFVALVLRALLAMLVLPVGLRVLLLLPLAFLPLLVENALAEGANKSGRGRAVFRVRAAPAN